MGSLARTLSGLLFTSIALAALARGAFGMHPPSGTIGMRVEVINAFIAPLGDGAARLTMDITTDTDGKLVAAFSRAAKEVQLHSGAARTSSIAIDYSRPTVLAGDGNHLLLVGLAKALVKDELVPVSLTFFGKDGQRKSLDIEATVR